MRKQHSACKELQVQVQVGEEFDWVTDAKSCDIHITQDHPLDKTDYHVVKGMKTPARVIGQSGEYEFECKCKNLKVKTNPKIVIK